MFSIKIMNIADKNYRFVLFILFVKCYYPYAWSFCPPIFSSKTTNVTCTSYRNISSTVTCDLPTEGTMACLSCNEFYEESTIEKNPCFLCKNDSWGAVIPNCYPICGKVRAEENFEKNLDTYSVPLPKYPWNVGIYIANRTLLCPGTLIAMNIVLTGEGCFGVFGDEIGDILVASGENYPQYLDKGTKFYQYSEVEILEIFVSKRQIPSDRKNMAILVLSNPFVPSRDVQPICVDFRTKFDNALFPKNGLMTSWDFDNHEEQYGTTRQLSTVFREITVKFVQCRYRECYRIVFGSQDGDCILFDSGFIFRVTFGIVVFKNLIDNRYYVKGIIWDTSCNANCTELNSIDHHLNFLEKFVTNNKIKNCVLPNHPQHGSYVLLNTSNQLSYEIGQLVPPLTQLGFICNTGYNFSSLNANELTCSNEGLWTSTPKDCIRISQPMDNKTDLLNNSDGMNKPAEFDYIYIILIVAVIILFIVALVTVIILKLKFNKKRKLRKELKMAGMDCFQCGNLKRFNPELGIDDQAELLPYNSNYEFPRDKLELGHQLGSGAFGIVLKAEAFGIIANEEKTTVAVKTVKSIIDDIQMKALVSELKIMIHLGQHLNVVNLLGACTRNIIKRELLVIVEYCTFGNLYNYLLQNRSNYVNQLDNLTGNIDYSINSEDFESVPTVHHNSSTSQESNLNNFSSLNSIENGVSELGDNRQDSLKLLYTKDLISWSFQIARGMEYLASRKIFHGDLAARNILLAENNIVKICDFGLAKRIYRTTNYKKNKDCPLPIKWMAIESIRDLVFSTQSDVWSYGIVLWELFSLAQTPYPGMEPDEKLYQKLLKGYRMESPSYAPKKMYKIMCDCWNIDPLSRPGFNKLAGTVGLLLEENIRQFYIDLNDPYFVMNTKRLSKGQNDYLVMLSAPEAIETPKYLCLKPTDLGVDQVESTSDNEDNMNYESSERTTPHHSKISE